MMGSFLKAILTTFPVLAAWWRKQTDQLIAWSCIKILSFGCQISTFCQANTVKTVCMLHCIADWETTGLTLWVQWEVLWQNALFECKFDSFPKSVLKLAKVSYLVSIYNTEGHGIFKIHSNYLKSRLNYPGWEKWHWWVFKSLYSVHYPYIERI